MSLASNTSMKVGINSYSKAALGAATALQMSQVNNSSSQLLRNEEGKDEEMKDAGAGEADAGGEADAEMNDAGAGATEGEAAGGKADEAAPDIDMKETLEALKKAAEEENRKKLD